MKVKVIKTFRDKKNTAIIHRKGEEFECSKERCEEILNKGKYIEVIGATETEETVAETEEVAPVQPKEKRSASKKKTEKEEEGDL